VQFVRLDPPGTLCHHAAIFDMLKGIDVHSFVEVGCGTGKLASLFCQRGLTGVGIDISANALQQAEPVLKDYLARGQFRLHNGDIMERNSFASYAAQFDLALSLMVMEHVVDDVGFLRNLTGLVKEGGSLIVAVPGRRDRWGIEDETVGHRRRYEREELEDKLRGAGLINVEVWSVAVPVANVLFFVGKRLLQRSPEVQKLSLSPGEQTYQSGLQEIPFKTVFPPWCKFLLNPTVWFPAFLFQRLFYRSRLGLILQGRGTVARSATARSLFNPCRG
jgi:SAM-dependent methyltransferase